MCHKRCSWFVLSSADSWLCLFNSKAFFPLCFPFITSRWHLHIKRDSPGIRWNPETPGLPFSWNIVQQDHQRWRLEIQNCDPVGTTCLTWLFGKIWTRRKEKNKENIARGTTDPGHSLYNLNIFSDRNQFEVGVTCIGPSLAKRWCTCSSNFGHQVALLALVVNLASIWRYLHFLWIWATVGVSCTTRWHHLNWL